MKTVNLHELYPDVYRTDYFVEVSDQIADEFIKFSKEDAAYRSYVRYHKAYYSLDCDDGIENAAAERPATPHDVCERKMLMKQLYDAIASLTDKQFKRIYMRYFLNMTLTDIARNEDVSVASVRESIERALTAMKKYLADWQ